MSDSAISWTAACQGALSFTISRSLLTLMSSESVITSSKSGTVCKWNMWKMQLRLNIRKLPWESLFWQVVSDVCCVSLREVENKASCLNLTGDDGWSHCSAYNSSCQALGQACEPGPLKAAGGGDGNDSRKSQLLWSALPVPPCHPGPNLLWQKLWFFSPLWLQKSVFVTS